MLNTLQSPEKFSPETQRERLEQARAECATKLQSAPDDAQCLALLGLIELQLGLPVEAEKTLAQALALRSDDASIHYHHGIALLMLGKPLEAIRDFRAVIALDPHHAEAFYVLGNALRDTGQSAEALQAFRQAIAVNPDHVDTLNNLGNLLKASGQIKEAIACFLSALLIRPNDAVLHNNLGSCFVVIGLLNKAEDEFRRAIDLHPDYPEALNNLGNVIYMQGNDEDTEALYRRALALRRDYPEALSNLSNALKDKGEMEEAVRLCRQVDAQRNTPEHRHNLALTLLAAGHLPEGFAANESRWESYQMEGARRPFSQPLWQGEADKGKTLLIHAEQGFGDTLQFCRYAPLAAARGLRVILEVQQPLARLMRSLKGVDMIVTRGDPLPDFDTHCPTLNLPLAFGTELRDIPATLPYLAAEKPNIALWRDRLPRTAVSTLRIGLAWEGSPRLHSFDLAATNRRRSINPELLAPLMNVPNAQFISLQKNGPPAPQRFGLIDLMEHCNDFADTAALMMNLDLLISVDTAPAHLAAALGKPVWLLNRYDNCWRWLHNREDTPWYPNMRLFRQPKPGDWGTVVANVKTELEKFSHPTFR